ncbi:MAG: hypothetical protein P8X50_16270 [Maritimibacter sp.]|jgi:hypothetical protein
MFGLVLWFNETSHTGLIWCEDQGPLAFLGPENSLPEGIGSLNCGDQLVFSFDTRDGTRYVRDVISVFAGTQQRDPAEVLTGYHQFQETGSHLRVVA